MRSRRTKRCGRTRVFHSASLCGRRAPATGAGPTAAPECLPCAAGEGHRLARAAELDHPLWRRQAPAPRPAVARPAKAAAPGPGLHRPHDRPASTTAASRARSHSPAASRRPGTCCCERKPADRIGSGSCDQPAAATAGPWNAFESQEDRRTKHALMVVYGKRERSGNTGGTLAANRAVSQPGSDAKTPRGRVDL